VVRRKYAAPKIKIAFDFIMDKILNLEVSMLKKNYNKLSKRLLSMFILLCMLCANIVFEPKVTYATNGCIIKRVYTDKSMYSVGNTVTITVVINNPSASQMVTALNTNINKLENNVFNNSINVTVPANTTVNQNVTWTAPVGDYTGYLVNVDLGDSVYATSAIDVSSDLKKFPRYGYSCDFGTGETSTQSTNLINEIAQDYHINMVQYYDWMYKHEKNFPSPTATTWNDLFGNTISKSSLQQRIDQGHALNQKAFAYQMAYMVREGYENNGVSKAWGLYKNRSYNTNYNPLDISTISNIDQLNFPLEGNPGPILLTMNPQNKDWQNFMIGQYKDAINTLSFDGIQVDQMGSFWGDISKYDYNGKLVDLGKTFSSMINNAKTQLTTNNPSKNLLTMNIVNGAAPGADNFSTWDIVNNANTDFAFSEIWGNSPSYNSLKKYIEYEKQTSGKPMVLAAYMNQNDNAGTSYEVETGTTSGLTQGTNSGKTYLTGFSTGDYVSISVNAPETGDYSLVFNSTNGASTRATKDLYVDGNSVGVINFDPTRTNMIPASPSWTSWSIEAASLAPKHLYLTAGAHTIKIQHDVTNTGDIWLDNMTLGTFNEASVRLTDAVISASGAGHIEMGTGLSEANGPNSFSSATMLAHPYYPKAFKSMRDGLRTAMKAQYNFTTAYENLLYDTDLTTGDGGAQNLSITGQSVSGSAEAGKIFFVSKNKSDKYGILHLINLTAETDTDWRNVTTEPTQQNNLAVKYYIPANKSVSNVYLASPDTNNCKSNSLSFTTGTDSNGKYLSFTVPSLKYWDMIYYTFGSENEPALYEAESALKSGVTTNTNHVGYTGTGFVDGYGTVNSSVTFDVKVATEGYFTLKYRYANATGLECSRELIIDNTSVGKTTFLNKANWDTWGTAEKGVYLKAGRHKLVLLTTAAYGGSINLDNLSIEPLVESARSLYMNNWTDTVSIWNDTEVNTAAALNGSGPGLYELRLSADYNTNNIKNYSMFLRNETDSVKYMDGAKFRSTGYYGSDGVLYNKYITYDGNTMTPEITKSFATVPNQKFTIAKYAIKNTTGATKTFKILDLLHVKNKGVNNITASYSSTNKAVTIDMSNAAQYYIAQGTLEATIDGYQVANDTISDTLNAQCSPWATFNNNGTLKNNTTVTTPDISTGLVKSVTLANGASQDVYFYIAAAANSADLASAITTARSQTGSYWFTQMNTTYTNWLNAGTRSNLTSTINTAYDRNLISIKQSIVPGLNFGSMPAATNPSAYSYKVWARDSAVTAMSLDASGHTTEAETYWTWLSNRQITTDQGTWKKPGTFWTCYWLWDNSAQSFVEPEYDSIGMFLVGAYGHYQKLTGVAQTTFLNNIWAAYKRSADFVASNVQSNGFGAADCSIWEETSEYNSFTQALYASGMDAAQEMAKAKAIQADADNYNGAAGTIRTAINRLSTDSNVGMWNQSDPNNRYFNRAVNSNGTARTTVDSSSDVLMTYGVVDMLSKRAYDHYNKVTSTIQHDKYGIARYQGDTFYTGVNSWDPGGAEALENEPSWPQMSMWVALMELYSEYDSLKANGLRRLQWYTDRCGIGYMAPGEAVSNISLKPAISTMAEPITAASFIMTTLAYQGSLDTRVVPSQYNAGACQTITVNSGCYNTTNQYDQVADWEQWKYIPYFLDKKGDNTGGTSTRDIKKVYLSNDANNIYIRVDNVGNSLPGYNVANDKFSIAVYSEDFIHNGSIPTASTSLNGAALSRPMNYMVTRNSDSTNFTSYTANGTGWVSAGNIASVIAPQWETNSGRIEMVIPKSSLSSTGSISDGSWANMTIMIGNNTGLGWSDVDSINIHLRATSSTSAWIFGNSEE
jgi:GH15 family glucan-1,4-alpha-glucosidase